VEARRVQLFDPLRHEKIAVRDETRDHAAPADVADQIVQLWMQHRFAAAERHDGGAQIGKPVDPMLQDAGRDRRRYFVVLVAVAAGDVEAPELDVLHERRGRGVDPPARDLTRGARFPADRRGEPHHAFDSTGRSRRSVSPILSDPLKSDATGMKPSSWWR